MKTNEKIANLEEVLLNQIKTKVCVCVCVVYIWLLSMLMKKPQYYVTLYIYAMTTKALFKYPFKAKTTVYVNILVLF